MKQTFWYIAVIAFTLLALILLWQFSISIVLFALSLAVTAALRPIINTIAIRTKSKRFALGLVYSLVIGSILVILAMGGQFLRKDLQKATDDFATGYEMIKSDWPHQESIFRQTLAEQLPSSNDLYQAITSEEGIIILTEGGGLADFFQLRLYCDYSCPEHVLERGPAKIRTPYCLIVRDQSSPEGSSYLADSRRRCGRIPEE